MLLTSVHHHSFTSFFGIFLYRDHLAVTDLKKVYEAMREIGRSDSEWYINLVKKFTHQTDSTSCGAFVCLFFECLAVGVSMKNKDSFDLDLQSYCELIAFSLCMGRTIGLHSNVLDIDLIGVNQKTPYKATDSAGEVSPQGFVDLTGNNEKPVDKVTDSAGTALLHDRIGNPPPDIGKDPAPKSIYQLFQEEGENSKLHYIDE